MADGSSPDQLDLEQSGISFGVREITGGNIKSPSLLTAPQESAGAVDQEDESVFYSERETPPEADVPLGVSPGPAETSARPGNQVFTEPFGTFICSWPAVGDVPGGGCESDGRNFTSSCGSSTVLTATSLGPTHNSPTPACQGDRFLQAFTEECIGKSPLDSEAHSSEQYSTDVISETKEMLRSQREAGVQTMDAFAPWKEDVFSLEWEVGGAIPASPPTSAPEEEDDQLNGGGETPGGCVPAEGLLHKTQDEKEEEEGDTTNEKCLDATSQHAGTPPSGRANKSLIPSSIYKYNTVSYRKIRKGNTKQKIDEFESMMNT